MPHARQYETFEVRQMLRDAEGVNSPVTGVGAHSRILHAQRTPGGVGVNHGDMMTRTHKAVGESNKQFSNRGGAVRTSAFANLLQQSDAACQALNSAKGRTALLVLDNPANVGRRLRVTLQASNILSAGFLAGSGQGRMSTVHKNDVAVTSGGAAGVQLIIDCVPGTSNLHIQTCYPLDNAPPGGSYEVKDLATNLTVSMG